MSEEKPLKIEELLEKGLYYYGLGENKMAVSLWQQTLELDPENELAREYLEIELGTRIIEPEPEPAPSQAPEKTEPLAIPPSFTRGQQLIYEGKPAEAVESFNQAYNESDGRLFHWAYVELAKTSVVKNLLEHIGSFEKMPELTQSMSELAKMNFTEEEGFMLSLITGDTSFEDVISLSPLPKYKTYRTLYRFLEYDIVRIKRT